MTSGYDYDAIVVGAGPAGSMAARTMAEKGLEVLVLEKDAEIGSPKRCAEGLSMRGFERAGLKYSPKYCAQDIRGLVLWAPNGKSVTFAKDETWGYVLERKIFEKHLAKDAIKAGADYMVRTTVHDLIKDKDGKAAGVKARYLGDEVQFTAPLVIGADGTETKVGRMAGLRTVNKLGDYISGFQYEMAGVEGLDQDKIHMWLGAKIVPKGYLWAFPKGDDLVNIGIGIISTENAKKSVRQYLDEFIVAHPEHFRNASPVEVNAGGIPVCGKISDPFVDDHIMLVGDSAHQVSPIHGGGMSTNLYAAQIAGRVAAEAVQSGDFSKKKLSEYESEWRQTDGRKMEKHLKVRLFVESLSDDDLNWFADNMKPEYVEDLQEGRTGFLLKMLIRKPKLMKYAVKYLKA
jgi:digeranylgeranylglycerophospholipid reductase